MRRILLLVALLAVIAATGITISWSGDSETDVDCDTYRFDAAAWRARSSSVGETPTARQRLADGLIACKTLQGASAHRARKMLGRPDGRDREGMAYQLGPERSPVQIDSEYLAVALRNGRVVGVSLYQG